MTMTLLVLIPATLSSTPLIIDIPLTSQRLLVRVTDEEGNPLSRSSVYFARSGDTGVATFGADADENGEAFFGCTGGDEVQICVRDPLLGIESRTVVLAASGTTELDIVMDGGDPLLLEVTDQEAGVLGVEAVCVPAGFLVDTVLDGVTDSHGELNWPGIAHGDYQIHLSRYGYWPTTHLIHFTGQPSISLPIRRRGKLEAIITTPSDTPIPGAQLTLYSVEFDTTVATWLAEGKLESSAAALQSDAKGRVFAHGIPHGVYDWTVTTPDGAVTSGQVTIPPGETLETSFQIGG
jgi:hypothetical protein